MSLNIVKEPSVYLVGRQVVDEDGLSAFLADEGVEHWSTDTDVGGEKLVETAGRLCYMSYAKPRPGGNEAYVDHILEVGHGSVLEHAVFSLVITGVSRSLTHELIRHRVGISPSQLSQRFVDESDAAFVVPPLIEDACRAEFESGDVWGQKLIQEARRRWHYAVSVAREQYAAITADLDAYLATRRPEIDKTLRRKRAREAARSVLPNATETKIFLTGNARALRHFLEMRGSKEADAEIRRLAVAVLMVLMAESPNLFGDYVVTPTGDGDAFISTEHRKV